MNQGTWTDHGSVGVQSNPNKPYNAIDGNLFVDEDGVRLNFGSYWHNIFQVRMNGAGTKATSNPTQIAYEPAGNHKMEGSYMYKHGGNYFLFYSLGVAGNYDANRPPAGEEYRIKVCKSSSPTGGFVSTLLFVSEYS